MTRLLTFLILCVLGRHAHAEPRFTVVTVDPDDRRGRRAALTDAGRALLAEATPIWIAEHAAVEAALDEAETLRAGLRRLG